MCRRAPRACHSADRAKGWPQPWPPILGKDEPKMQHQPLVAGFAAAHSAPRSFRTEIGRYVRARMVRQGKQRLDVISSSGADGLKTRWHGRLARGAPEPDPTLKSASEYWKVSNLPGVVSKQKAEVAPLSLEKLKTLNAASSNKTLASLVLSLALPPVLSCLLVSATSRCMPCTVTNTS